MFALLIIACLGADADPRHTEFSQAMNGVEMVGSFTVDGKAEDGQMKKESYTIRSVEKLPEGDLWRFVARIQYGETDIELPMDLPVKWAENTAVITLDNVWLPGLGTFSSRVLIHDNKYAGTWRHDDHGGHLFGAIKRLKINLEPDKATEPAAKESPAKKDAVK